MFIPSACRAGPRQRVDPRVGVRVDTRIKPGVELGHRTQAPTTESKTAAPPHDSILRAESVRAQTDLLTWDSAFGRPGSVAGRAAQRWWHALPAGSPRRRPAGFQGIMLVACARPGASRRLAGSSSPGGSGGLPG